MANPNPGDGPPCKRGPYKRYLVDQSLPIPRTTLQSRRYRADAAACDNVEGPPQMDVPPDQDMEADDNSPPHSEESDDVQTEGSEGVLEDEVSVHEEEFDLSPTPSDPAPDVINYDLNTEIEHEVGEPAGEVPAPKQKKSFVEKHSLKNRLHPNSPVTRLEVLLMILHLAIRHCNTQHFIEDQICFVNALYGEKVLDVSYYIFQQVFPPSASIVRHYFCPDCEVYLGKQTDFDKSATCPHCSKTIDVTSIDSKAYFVTLSVRDQIDKILNRPGLKLIKPSERNSNSYSDIFDGEVYKSCSRRGHPFSNKNAISVTFNTDGVCVQKQTKNTLYPILMYINEIAPEERFKSENLIVGGIWFGKSAPNMAMFLKPTLNELLDLSNNPVKRKEPDGSLCEIPVFPVAVSLDAVAKAKVLCMKQFNGFYGCLYCLHPNDTPDPDSNNRLLRHYDTSTTYPLRTEQSVVADMIEADTLLQENELGDGSVQGFKGLSVLLVLRQILNSFASSSFHIVWSVVIDYLHAICEGVGSALLDLFESTMSEQQWKCFDNLQKLTPPKAMTQRPRTLAERTHWKAKEYRSFLLYYALPCLEDVLPQRNFVNLKFLVRAFHILLSDNISSADLQQARTDLQSFVSGYQRLYGISRVTYNLHVCTHLADCVKMMGPLWCWSNFFLRLPMVA